MTVSDRKRRYTFFNEQIRLYGQPAGIDEFDAHPSGILSHPLLYEPGTDWTYGVRLKPPTPLSQPN